MRHGYKKPVSSTQKNAFDKSRYGAEWDKVKQLTPLSGRRCAKCGTNKDLQRHHRVPLSKGGKNVVSNVEILCINCHARQHHHKMKRK